MWLYYQKPLSVRDKLRAHFAQRRNANEKESQLSNIKEVFGLMEELLEDFIGEIDETEEEERREREELSQRCTALSAANKQIERNALSRRLSVEYEGVGSGKKQSRQTIAQYM